MATLGNATTPSGGYIYNDYGAGYQYWSTFTMPSGGGVVTDVYVYAGGDGVSWTGDLCVWSGSTLAWSGAITFPSNGRTNGGQQWLHLSVPSVYVAAGSVSIGFYAGGNAVWTQEGSGTAYRSSGNVGGSPAALGGSVSASNALGAYVTYTPAGIKRWRVGTGWVAMPLKRWKSGAWVNVTLKRWKSGAWVNVN